MMDERSEIPLLTFPCIPPLILVAADLRLPRGGVAKGMPRKVATGWRWSAGCCSTPCTGPYLVWTFLSPEYVVMIKHLATLLVLQTINRRSCTIAQAEGSY